MNDAQTLLPGPEQRLTQARAVIADMTQHPDAVVSAACTTILQLLPQTKDTARERGKALRTIQLLHRGTGI